MNKRICSFLVFLLCTVALFNISAEAIFDLPDAKSIGNVIENALPTEFGYVDSTDFYLKNYFSELEDVDDCYIVTSAESTNYSEFGIFHLKSKENMKSNKKLLQNYLQKKKTDFESGVIYNIDEYPKFQNATVFAAENYICYVILTPSDIKKASAAVKNMLK